MTEKKLMFISKCIHYSGLGESIYRYKLYHNIKTPGNILKIINYHSVFSHEKGLFDNQLKYYNDHFNIITPGELQSFFENRLQRERPNLLITFDDGSLSQYQVALNVLEKHGVKAIFFVPAGVLELHSRESQKAFAFNQLYFGETKGKTCEFEFMTKSQLQELTKGGHEIGSHTISHCRFALMKNEKVIQREIELSKRMLETATGKSVHFFGYPKGNLLAYHPLAVELTRKYYDFAFFALRGINTPETSRWFLQRDPIHPSYPMSYVKSLLRGDFDWVYQRRMKKILHRHSQYA